MKHVYYMLFACWIHCCAIIDLKKHNSKEKNNNNVIPDMMTSANKKKMAQMFICFTLMTFVSYLKTNNLFIISLLGRCLQYKTHILHAAAYIYACCLCGFKYVLKFNNKDKSHL